MEFMTIEQLGELLYLRWCEHTNPGKPMNVTWALLTEDQRVFWTNCVFIVSEHTRQYAMQSKNPYPAWRYEDAMSPDEFKRLQTNEWIFAPEEQECPDCKRLTDNKK